MKNTLRKALALLLCLVMCLSLLPLSALAEEPEAEETPVEDVQPEEEPAEEPAEEPEEPAEEPEDFAEAEDAELPEAQYGEDVIVGFDSANIPETLAFDYKLILERLRQQLPETLTVELGGTVFYLTDADGNVQIVRTEPLSRAELPVVWVCAEDYDEQLDEYHFSPALEDHALAEGLFLPVVTVSFAPEPERVLPVIVGDKAGSDVPYVSFAIMGGEAQVENTLPRKYDNFANGALPPVRDQGDFGTCWAHSAIGSLEADLIHDGAADTNIDLSELHLAYFSTHVYEDEKGCNEGDSVALNGLDYLQFGNAVTTASHILGNMVGPALESQVPYTPYGDTNYSYAPSASEGRARAGLQLTGTYEINPCQLTAVKQAIMDHGGVSATILMENEYYSSTYNSFYCPSANDTNHAIMLVGWDDDFDASHFRSEAPGNGAWLLRNSWGLQDYGSNGYFWISYYDASLLTYPIYAIDAQDWEYGHCYAYCGCPGVNSFNMGSDPAGSISTVYHVDAGEELRAVGVITANADISLDILVEVGDESVVTSIDTSFAGYYLVELPEAIALKDGGDVTVTVVYYFSGDGDSLLPVETGLNVGDKDAVLRYIPGVAGGLRLDDTWDYDTVDPTIRLFTDDLPKESFTVSYDANGGSGAPAAQTKQENVPLTLSSEVPTRRCYRFLGWATTATATAAEYQPGSVYNDDADLTLYAVWEYVGVEIDEEAFPDESFREYVARCFDDGDGFLTPNEIAAVKEIDLQNCSGPVKSLEGVKLFTALETLDCFNNALVSLDVSGMSALRELDCSDNRDLASLDVGGCTALETLGCAYCDLDALDVGDCGALKDLGCSGNRLPTLDISACTALETLSCAYNQLGELDLSPCPKLWALFCNGNALTALDVSLCPELMQLTCDDNKLTALDLSKCTKLTGLGCGRNQLSALDVSSCPELTSLDCSVNRIGALDLGQNARLETLFCYGNELSELDVSRNPLLELLSCPGNALLTLDVSACPALVDAIFNGERETGVYLGFTWTSFETVSGMSSLHGLVVDSSLAEHGLNPPAILPASLSLENGYLALAVGETKTLRSAGLDPLWEPELVWAVSADGKLGSDTAVIEISADGEVKALQEGTAYAVAYLERNGKQVTASCRIDVTEDAVAESVTGVRLTDTKAAVELYSTDYARVTLVPVLDQNQSADAASPIVPPAPSPGPNLGSAIGHAWFEDDSLNRVFTLHVVDDRTLEIMPNQEYVTLNKDKLKELKGSYKSAIKVTVGGEVFTTPELLSVSIKKTMPKVTVKLNKFNSFIPGDTQALLFTGAAVKSVELDQTKAALQPNWLSLDPEARSVKYTGANDAKLSGKLYLLAEPEGWNVLLPVELAVSAAPTNPKLTLRTATLSLQSAVDEVVATEAAVTLVSFEDNEKWSLGVVGITEGKNDASDALSVKIVGSSVAVEKGGGAPTDGKAHTYKVTLALKRDGEATKVTTALTVKLLAASAKPGITAKATGAIDTAIPRSFVTIALTPKNISPHSIWVTDVTVSGVKGRGEAEDMSERFDWYSYGSEVFVEQQQGQELDAGYAYTAKITTNVGAETSVKLTVKASDPNKVKPGVTLKATGSIDVIRPASAVTVTPTVKNCASYWFRKDELHIWKVQGKNYTDVSDCFDVEVKNGVFILTLRDDSVVDHTKDKFAVSLKTTLNGTEVESPKVNITVKMGTAKLNQSTKAVTLLKDDRYSRAAVTITPAEAGLRDIDWEKSLAAFVSPVDKAKQPLFALTDLGNGTVAIGYAGSAIKEFKSATVKLPVFFKGNNSTKANATISVSVKAG